MTHQLCLGHGLHNHVIVDGINSVPKIAVLVHKLKKIVKTMRYLAPELQAEAEKIQLQLEFLGSLDKVVEAIEVDKNNHIVFLPEHEVITFEDTEKLDEAISSCPSGSRYYRHTSTVKTPTPTCWQNVL